jgi:hypothetical protein
MERASIYAHTHILKLFTCQALSTHANSKHYEKHHIHIHIHHHHHHHTTTVPTAFAKELAMWGIVRVEFGTASAYWGHTMWPRWKRPVLQHGSSSPTRKRAAIATATGWHYPETVGLRVYPTSFEEVDAAPPPLIGGLPIAEANVSVG